MPSPKQLNLLGYLVRDTVTKPLQPTTKWSRVQSSVITVLLIKIEFLHNVDECIRSVYYPCFKFNRLLNERDVRKLSLSKKKIQKFAHTT